MNIEHIALWTSDLERMSSFYQTYFGMKRGERYENTQKGFSSYFLSFESGARIEIMHRADILSDRETRDTLLGLAHFALSLGSREMVDSLTERLRLDGLTILSEPRITGDGYYESVILDPEGNRIELTE